MKKWLALAATAVLGASLLISGCGSSTNDADSAVLVVQAIGVKDGSKPCTSC